MTEREQWGDSPRTAAKPATISLNTRELDMLEGRSRWVDTLGRLYCEMDVAWPDAGRHFDGQWGGRRFGSLHVSTILAGVHTVVRSPAMIRSDSATDYLVCLVTDGRVEVRQGGRGTTLEQGSFALLDCSAPFVFESGSQFRQVVVQAPRDLLVARLPGRMLEQGTARAISGSSGAGKLVSRFLLDVASVDDDLALGPAVSFASSALDMLVTALAEGVVPTSTTELSHARDLTTVQRIIEQRLHDAELTLSDIAGEAGMSVRHVQKVFSEAGFTPHAWLYRARLDRARQYLLTTEFTVAEVSEAVGFRDVSHFSRTFRTAFGVSPGRYRTQG